MIAIYILLLLAGFAGLIKGADLFVDGSCGLARRFHVSELIIGLTIVSMGTSAPELAVSTTAAIQGSNEIALSNVVGSNIFNLLVVLGVCAVIKPVPVDTAILKRDFPVSISAALFVLLCSAGKMLISEDLRVFPMSETVGMVSRPVGIILLIGFALYLFFLVKSAKKENTDGDDIKLSLRKCVLMVLIGVALIIAGGQAVVFGAKNIALLSGMTETLVGLTVVAVGTSLPELVTSIVAARKGETSLAVGNALGSNVFNLLFILGISATIRPLGIKTVSVYDLILLIILSIIGYLFAATNKRISRIEGLFMTTLYVCYVAYAVCISGMS